MENKTVNPKLRQSEIAKDLGMSTSILQRYRHDIEMQCRHESNAPKRLLSSY